MGIWSFFLVLLSHLRGVAILFYNNCELDVHKTFKDDNGNCFILDVSNDHLHVLSVNLYGPIFDTPALYANLFHHIEIPFTNQHIVIGLI